MQAGLERCALLPAAVWPADRRATRFRSDALAQRTAHVFGAERFTPRDFFRFERFGRGGEPGRENSRPRARLAVRCGISPRAPRACRRGTFVQGQKKRPGPGPRTGRPRLPSRPLLRSRFRSAGSAVGGPALPDSTPPPGSAGSPQADAPAAAQRPLLHKALCSAVRADSGVVCA